MPAETTSYSLSLLADLAGVTPRTIRYYISQGLLPPPIGAGSTTRYADSHLLRLRLVRELQRQHLPLSEIRARLRRLTDDEVRDLTSSMEHREPVPETTGSAMDYIRALLVPSRYVDPRAAAARPESAGAAPSAPAPPPAAEALAPRAAAEAPALYAAVPRHAPPADLEPPAPQSARSQWERIVLDPDIELHVRRPLSRIQNRAVDRLIARARQLLEEDLG